MTAVAAAVLFALVSAAVIAFQLGLAVGMPWGAYAMGGAYPGRLPPRLRAAAVIQTVALVVLALVVLSDAGVVWPGPTDAFPWLVWIAVAFSAVSVVLNGITRSVMERRLWLPVAVLMLATSIVVALS